VATEQVPSAPATAQPPATESLQEAAARAKAEKIRLAIEKIREASVKKIFIKVISKVILTFF